MSMYSVMEDNENKIYIEWLKGVQLPPDFIQHPKVLPYGMQFSLLVGVPRWMYEESYMKAHMGGAYNNISAIFQALDCYIIQPICKLFPETCACIEGTLQIVDLNEECVELRILFLTTLAMLTRKELSISTTPGSSRVP